MIDKRKMQNYSCEFVHRDKDGRVVEKKVIIVRDNKVVKEESILKGE